MPNNDPDKKPTPKEIEAANKIARELAIRKGLVSGENTYVGNSIPKYYDERHRELPPDQPMIPERMIMKVPPPYVKQLEWNPNVNLPYFIDEKTGDIQYVDKSWFYTDRFNPNRGKSKEEIMSNLPMPSIAQQIPKSNRL